MCFLTSWLVLLVGVPFRFTPWGFVSGLFMVPGGTAGYFAVRNAGLALSQGIWSSLKVLVAFGWGIFVFHEPVRSKLGTGVAVLFMMLGLMGMSLVAAPSRCSNAAASRANAGSEPLLPVASDTDHYSPEKSTFGLQNRHLGILGAVIDGAYGGSILVPMHYANKADTAGLSFVLSFAIGCSTVVTAVWILRFLYASHCAQSFSGGLESLPSFYVTTIGPSAVLAGLIWSVGNVSAILSVSILGQGVGYSIVQSQLLVAGLWGVLWYKEIRGPIVVASWFLFAGLTVVGILLLSQEHV